MIKNIVKSRVGSKNAGVKFPLKLFIRGSYSVEISSVSAVYGSSGGMKGGMGGKPGGMMR